MYRIRVLVTREHSFITSRPELGFVSLDGGSELGWCLFFHGPEMHQEISSISNSIIEALTTIYQSKVK